MLDKNNKIWYNVLINAILNVIIFVLLFLIILYFIISPVYISGKSMENTLYNNQIVATTRFKPSTFDYNDIVIAKTEDYDVVIKRIIAKEGDKIAFVRENVNSDFVNLYFFENNNWILKSETFIKEKMRFSSNCFSLVKVADSKDFIKNENIITVEENSFFVMGDNRNFSADSRTFGCIKYEDIVSKQLFNISQSPFFNFLFSTIYSIF